MRVIRLEKAVPLLLMWFCVSSSSRFPLPSANAEPLLIRPLRVYESLIEGVHDYFNNTCVILFHGSTNSVEGGGERAGIWKRGPV